MKKVLFLTLCLFNSVWAMAQFSGSGEGTEASPYLIYNENQLAQVANFLNQEGVVFKLQKDLDLSNYISENNPNQGWTPIGVESSPFKGVFNGNGHKISGLFINRQGQDNVGFFGYVDGANISDLTIEATSVTGKNNIGILCGKADNNLTNITKCDVIITGKLTGYCHIGAISGNMFGKINRCGIRGNIESISGGSLPRSNTGAICGTVHSTTISNCKAYSNIAGVNTNVGGLIGSAQNTCTLLNCYFIGDVSGVGNVGGCVGYIAEANVTFTNTHSKGKIVNTGDNTGGILGMANGGGIEVIENCSHFGDIEGENYVGGIVGNIVGQSIPIYYRSSSSTNNTKIQTYTNASLEEGTPRIINNCTSIGNFSGKEYVGGIVGSDAGFQILHSNTGGSVELWHISSTYYLWMSSDGGTTSSYTGYEGHSSKPKDIISTISFFNNYFSGNLYGTNNIGGITGYKDGGEITNCYTYATIFGNSNVGGVIGEVMGNTNSRHPVSVTLKSNVAINSGITANTSNVGRIYGLKSNDKVTIGALATQEGNRALTQTSVMLCGVAQDVVDDLQNGTSVGSSMLKLKANYVSWGWNFDENWDILETECYPYKKYQAAPPVIESSLVSHATEIKGKSINGGTVYMYYKDREPVYTQCSGNQWSFTTEELQSGAQVQLYADVDDMTPSYFTSAIVKYPGSGTEADPYRIYSAEDLQGASNSGYYKVMNDIDLTNWISENSPTTGWQAVGRNSTAATYIDGDGHKVTGLWINTTDDYNGLFSNYSAGYIKNLTVEVASGKKVKGGDYTGILIGRMYNGQIINCTIKGNVQGTTHVGGIVGYTEKTTLKKDTYTGTVTSNTANAYVGGIAGHAKTMDVTNNSAESTITASGNTSFVGGLFGYVENGVVTKSNTNTNITAKGTDNNVGGLIGKSSASVSNCYSEGTITASGDNSYTGGFVGTSYNPIKDCYSTATTSGTFYTAGLVGYSYSSIDKCYAKGDVAGVMYGAGVVGELDGTKASLSNSVALNNIISLTAQSSWGCRVVGGFKNGCNEPDDNNYALSTMQVSLNGIPQRKSDDNIEGIAKTAGELMTTDFYESLGWDMNEVWSIDEGSSYPYMQYAEDVVLATGIALDQSTISIKPGETVTLLATIIPDNATKKSVVWTSSNQYVATVENGVITALTTGTTTITATTTDGTNLTAECKVTVTAKDVEPQVEDTDIAQYDNIIYFEKTTAKAGEKIVLPLQLKNKMEVAAMRFDVEFPEGVTLDKNSRGKYDIRFNAEAERSDATIHSLSSALQADGSVRVVVFSSSADVFYGNEGAIFDFPVTLSSDMEAGDYKIRIKNIELTQPNGISVKLDEVISTLNIPDYILGDANNDSEIGMSDIMYIVNYLLGTPADDFNENAADANQDGEIGMSDVMFIVQYLLTGEFPQNNAAAAKIMFDIMEQLNEE